MGGLFALCRTATGLALVEPCKQAGWAGSRPGYRRDQDNASAVVFALFRQQSRQSDALAAH